MPFGVCLKLIAEVDLVILEYFDEEINRLPTEAHNNNVVCIWKINFLNSIFHNLKSIRF